MPNACRNPCCLLLPCGRHQGISHAVQAMLCCIGEDGHVALLAGTLMCWRCCRMLIHCSCRTHMRCCCIGTAASGNQVLLCLQALCWAAAAAGCWTTAATSCTQYIHTKLFQICEAYFGRRSSTTAMRPTTLLWWLAPLLAWLESTDALRTMCSAGRSGSTSCCCCCCWLWRWW